MDTKTPLTILLKKAEEGDHSAQYEIGMRMKFGIDFHPDASAAMKWFAEAASGGHALAEAELKRLQQEVPEPAVMQHLHKGTQTKPEASSLSFWDCMSCCWWCTLVLFLIVAVCMFFWGCRLMAILKVVGIGVISGLVIGFMFSWYLRSEEERKLREKRKEEYRRRKDEMLMSPQPFCRVLEMHDRDKIIVDTNVFMNAVEEEGNEIGERNEHKTYLKSAWFFGAVRQMKLQIHILTSQLNEISKIRRENDDRSKQYKARGALKLMDELQDEGLMVVLDDVITTRQSYADPEILKIVRKLLEEGQRPFVITEDRDLKIRVVALSVPCMPIDGIYNEGCMLQKRDWREDFKTLTTK